MNSRQPIVWVMKEQTRRSVTGPEAMDYTPAMKYGELRFITDFDLPIHHGGTLTGAWWKSVEAFMHEYDPDRDFIVATGQPLAMVLIGFALGMCGAGPTFLIWRREENRYVPYKATIPLTVTP